MKKLLIFLVCFPQLSFAMLRSFSLEERERHIAGALEKKRKLYKVVEERIKNNRNLNDWVDLETPPPLLEAAWSDDNIGLTKRLLENGADPNLQSGITVKTTAIYNATSTLSMQTVRLLLEKGSDPNLPNSDGAAALDSLCNACKDSADRQKICARKKIMKLLIQYKADPNRRVGLFQTTPLNCLIASFPYYSDSLNDLYRPNFLLQRKKLIKIMAQSGANIFSKNSYGITALQRARAKGKPELIELAEFAENLKPNLLRLLTYTGKKGQSPFARIPEHIIAMPKNADKTNITLPKEIVEMIVDWIYPCCKP